MRLLLLKSEISFFTLFRLNKDQITKIIGGYTNRLLVFYDKEELTDEEVIKRDTLEALLVSSQQKLKDLNRVESTSQRTRSSTPPTSLKNVEVMKQSHSAPTTADQKSHRTVEEKVPFSQSNVSNELHEFQVKVKYRTK